MQRRGKRKKLEYWKRGEKNYDDLCCPSFPPSQQNTSPCGRKGDGNHTITNNNITVLSVTCRL